MNNYKQGKIFISALNEADTLDIDMSAEDWAQSVGLMHSYGHGYIFEDFTKAEAIKKIEEYAEWIAKDAEKLEA